MSKYLIFQDGHYKLKNSINRIGNYSSDWLEKFDELLSIAKQYNVKAIIDNGDLYDIAEPNYKTLDHIADRIEENKILIISLYGNHCMLYMNLESSRYVGLTHLMKRSKYYQYLPDVKFDDMEVIAIDYGKDVEERLKNENLLNFKTNKMRVGFIHAMVTPKAFLPQVCHVQCKDLENSGNCTLFIGHYHCDFDMTIDTTRFLNLACFGRNSITEAKIKPKVAILDTETRKIEIIELKSAKKGEEVFDMDKVEKIKTFDKGMTDFIKSLESTEFQSTNIKGMIQELAKEKEVSKEVVDLIMEKMKDNHEDTWENEGGK